MRLLLPTIVVVPLLTLFSQQVSIAEVYQLTAVERAERPAGFEEISPERLLDKEQGKKFIFMFLRASPDEKFTMCTDTYKKRISDGGQFRKIFNKESYDKIDFQELKVFERGKTKQIDLKANLYWFMEGMEGVQTFYFTLVKEKDRWLLDWIVF